MTLETTERIEYRVLGVTPEHPPIVGPVSFERPAVDTLTKAAAHVRFEEGYGSTDLRIQTRTVTETPWVDLPESKQGEQ